MLVNLSKLQLLNAYLTWRAARLQALVYDRGSKYQLLNVEAEMQLRENLNERGGNFRYFCRRSLLKSNVNVRSSPPLLETPLYWTRHQNSRSLIFFVLAILAHKPAPPCKPLTAPSKPPSRDTGLSYMILFRPAKV